MNIYSLGVVLILLCSVEAAAPVSAQSVVHAPNIEQCQADSALWASQAKLPEEPGSLPSVSVLLKRIEEMEACRTVDTKNATTYSIALSLQNIVIESRVSRFLDRHNLKKQFEEEDAAGQR
jgi:hypothetical protein